MRIVFYHISQGKSHNLLLYDEQQICIDTIKSSYIKGKQLN